MNKEETVDLIIDLVFGLAFAFALMALAGCAPTVPYTHERPTVPFHITPVNSRGVDSWTADGAPTVLTVKNPTPDRVQMHVVCEPSVSPTYIDYGHIEWWLCLQAGGETRRLTEFMNVDAMTQVCHVESWWRMTPKMSCIGDAL